MMKKWMKFTSLFLILVVLTVTYTVMANPGSNNDPVISLSYLKEIFQPEVEKNLTFNVVSVKKGQTLIGDTGTEMILRMGQATIIATNMGGIADTTAGFDLANGTDMPSNHYLIIPKNDGRGVKAKTDCLIMVKGKYEIK